MSDPLAALRAVSGDSPVSGGTPLPNIPAVPMSEDAALTNWMSSVKLWLEKANAGGLTGFASKQDLINAGLLTVNPDGSTTPAATGGGSGGAPTLAIPPTPTNLVATGAFTNILLEWSDPRQSYSNHGYTEVWAAETDNFSGAVMVGQAAGFLYSHNVGADATRYYWIRFVSTTGIQGPFNDVAGTMGQTSKDPQYLLDILTGQLTESQLYADLNSRIDLIDGSGAGSVNARLADEAAARGAAISAETTARQAADSSLAQQITTLTAAVNTADASLAAAIETEATARATADTAEATERTALAARVTTAEGNITSQATQISDRYTKAQTDSAISSATTTITAAYQSADTATLNSAKSYSDAVIVTEQTARASADSALSSSITTLQSTVDGHTTSIQTNATSINGIEAKYTVKIDANGYVSGYGLISTANDGTPTSEFTIVADKFSIAPVATSPSAADGSPFYYLTTPTTVNGVTIPAGAYMKAAYISDASITNAKIGNVSADKITAGYISADRIAANSVTADKINGTNLAVVNGTFSGSLQAATGTFTGSLSAATGTFAGRLAAGVLDPSAFSGTAYNYGTPGSYLVTVPNLGGTSTSMRLTLQGGGGGGGGGASSSNVNYCFSGGGGGAGSLVQVTISGVTPGAQYWLTVGGGGGGGVVTDGGFTITAGGTGGSTTFAGYTAAGGQGGGPGNPYSWIQGTGGSIGGAAGQVTWLGDMVGAKGGRGGSSAYGAGGGADAAGGVGAGGGGGSAGPYDVDRNGAAGGAGYASIEFFDPNTVILRSEFEAYKTSVQSSFNSTNGTIAAMVYVTGVTISHVGSSNYLNVYKSNGTSATSLISTDYTAPAG